MLNYRGASNRGDRNRQARTNGSQRARQEPTVLEQPDYGGYRKSMARRLARARVLAWTAVFPISRQSVRLRGGGRVAIRSPPP